MPSNKFETKNKKMLLFFVPFFGLSVSCFLGRGREPGVGAGGWGGRRGKDLSTLRFGKGRAKGRRGNFRGPGFGQTAAVVDGSGANLYIFLR
jgi:hypothetical protein